MTSEPSIPDERPPQDSAEPGAPERAAARRRLEAAGWKLIVIAAGSALIPVAGAAFALFAMTAALSIRRRAAALPPDSPARARATLAALLALAAGVWQAVLVAMWWGHGV